MENAVTPVYLTAQEGHLHVLRYLVEEAGGSMHVRAKDGMTPMQAADGLACLQWMVEEKGIDPHITDKDGATPVHLTASRGHPQAMRWLLRHGAKVKGDKYGRTVVNDVSDNQHVECVAILLQPGKETDEYAHPCSLSEVTARMKTTCTCPHSPAHSNGSTSPQSVHASPSAADPQFAHKPPSSALPNNTQPFFLHSPQPLKHNAEHGRSSSDPGPSMKPFFLHEPGRERNCDRLRVFFHEGSFVAQRTLAESHDGREHFHPQPRELNGTENGTLHVGMSPDSLTLSSRASPVCESKSLPLEVRASTALGRQVSLPPPPPPLPMEENENGRSHLKVLQRHASMPALSSQTETPANNLDGGVKKCSESGNLMQTLPNHDGRKNEEASSNVPPVQKSVPPFLAHRQMPVPFIPPKFPTASTDSDCLIKPSEYLRAVAVTKNEEEPCLNNDQDAVNSPVPPPPQPPAIVPNGVVPSGIPGTAVTLQDLQKVQLKKTDGIMKKQLTINHSLGDGALIPKDELIAELKMSKDIQGVRKLKEERAKIEVEKGKKQEDELNRHFTANNFVDQIPEIDVNGIPIPPWKRQMLAKRAAEKAKKDAEEQRLKDAEEKRMNTIPLWKRQLMHKKDPEGSVIPAK